MFGFAVLNLGSGLVTYMFCKHTFHINNGLLTGTYVLMMTTANIAVLCGSDMTNIIFAAVFVVINITMILMGGLFPVCDEVML